MADQNGDRLSGIALAQTCDELLESLLDLEEPIHGDMKDARTRLKALSVLLRKIEPLEDQSFFQAVLGDCSEAMNQICATKNNQLACDTADFTPSRQATIVKQIEALADVQNNISLALNLSLKQVISTTYNFALKLTGVHSNDELQDAITVESIKRGLDAISGHLISVADDILPATPSSFNKKTFKLCEIKLAIDGYATVKANDTYLVLSTTYLVEQMRPGKDRAWQMILFKPRINAIVSVIISEVPSTYTYEIDSLAQSLAHQFSKDLTASSKNKEIVFAEQLVLRLPCISPPEAFLNTLPWQVEFKTSNGISPLAWQPKRAHMKHYSVATGLRDRKTNASLDFLPSSEFEIEILKESSKASNDDFNILGDICDEILNARHAYTNFGRASPTLEQKSITEGSQYRDVSISVISSSPNNSIKNKLRMVMKRNGSSSSVCLDFGLAIRKIAQRGFHGSLDLIKFWTYDNDGLNTPVVQQTNWDELVTRGKSRQLYQLRGLNGPQVLSEREVSSDHWFEDIERLGDAMRSPAFDKGTYKLVKVCVIDTGFKPSVKGFEKIKAFKDFAEPTNTNLRDGTWHGTMCANIIMSIYEQCELYVARVFMSDDTDDKTGPEAMAQAIEWAITPDIDVDIISISAGFVDHSPRLQDAVQKASAANTLVFAAASNWGNWKPVAFPARHNLYTICIFSTDTHNRPSKFNPERRPNAHNFAILGEDFQHPGIANERVHGTSTATAAAAGLAALIIDFTRQQGNYEVITRAADVSKMLGMIAVFNAMSERAGEFKCIMPLKLLPAKNNDMDNQEMRAYIRESLSRGMDQAN
ncbi:hypothetical protein TRIATDRAFT_319912 [Trichoderma atroviride IMI 206040]|uniref:Peptidase S8/S53 domain-containing protein n=1 Tax=Hypocrea atroviridis (strain ATCC 20476 / IMI 206040) TaxID=452589 RepID=G9P1E1_HYPAI|nr:uncharacterized protein TRIATDRAFT_319912 [Trichoderma atroviride IMI 206040]EHK42494.1 hypothetical protein TRIATDRAFT_319912 [Trichoderma atroviride IMI 206040]